MSKSNVIAVIITALNEERTIGGIVEKTKSVLGNDNIIIVVDDGSHDSTAKIAREKGATFVISHEKNRGVGAAFKTGVLQALSSNADIIVKMDGDGQHLPEEIPKLIQPILDDEADVVLGTRFSQKIQMPLTKKIGNRIVTWLMRKSTGYTLTDTQTGFRAIRGTKAQLLLPSAGVFTYCQEMIIHAAKNGIKIVEVPITVKERKHGKSRVVRNPIAYGFKVILILLRTFRDYSPLLTFGVFGIVLLGFSFFLYLHLFYDWVVQGISFTSNPITFQIATILLVSSIQILLFAFLADMIKGLKAKE
ncbi:MAG: glycosyltransferase family 2 protein [Promethearchaeota archaeon]